MSFVDHRRKILQRGGTFGRYLPTSKHGGHLIFVNRGTLFALPFDADLLDVHGAPVPVLEQVTYSDLFGFAQLDFSRNGTLIYRSGANQAGLVTIQWLDGMNNMQPILAKPSPILFLRLSPNGRRLAFSIASDLWTYEPERAVMTRLTFDSKTATSPVWTPDGRYIVFREPSGMFWTRSDGSSSPQPLTQGTQIPTSFTSDGKRLAFDEYGPTTGNDVWTVPVQADAGGLRLGKPEPFLQTRFSERSSSFSPDGQWIAYQSDETGIYEVYVKAFPDRGGKWQISSGGGAFPGWSRVGHRLFYRGPDSHVMVADYTTDGDSFAPEKPRAWSDRRLASAGGTIPSFDLGPDDKRIAVLMPVEDETQSRSKVIFLQNFFDELRRKVPLGK